MKKSIFTICAILFILPISVIAQPIIIGVVDSNHYLNASTSPLGVEIDSIATVNMSGSPAFPTLTPHNNYNWDFTPLFYSSFHLAKYLQGISPYQNSDSEGYSIGPLKYYAFDDNFFVYDGWKCHYQHIDSQTIVIKKGNDSATIAFSFISNFLHGPGNSNNLAYKNNMPFPTTYGTSWSSDYHFVHPFNMVDNDSSMTIPAITAGGHHYERVVETDNVVGYGLAKINAADSTPSRLIHVLQVKKVKHYTDSVIFPPGTPARLYDSTGLSPYYLSSVYEMDFYTTQLLSPLVHIVFTDSTMTVPQSAEISVGNLAGIDDSTAGVTVITNNSGKMTVYPNPVNNGFVFIDIPGAKTGNWSFELYTMSGQALSSGKLALDNNNTKAQLFLPAGIAPGLYFIGVNHDGSREASAPLIISK